MKGIVSQLLLAVCSWCDMTHRDFEGFLKRTALIKYYVIKHLILLKIQRIINMNLNLLQWFKLFDEKSFGGAATGAD